MNCGRILVCSAILGALVGCGDEGPSEPVFALCDRTVTLTVGTGVTPRFEWSPACRVTMLAVRNTVTNTSAWTVIAGPFSPGGIAPPVIYGTAPPGAVGLGPEEEALEPGTAYVVVLSVIELSVGEQEVGRRQFTP